MNERCADHLSTLLRLVARGDEVPLELKSHLAACEECVRLLDAMNRVQADLESAEGDAVEETVVAETLARSAAAVRRSSRGRNAARAAAVAVLIAAAAGIIGYSTAPPGQALVLAGGIFLGFATLLILLAVLRHLRQRFHAPGTTIYKRLKPGRQVDGVCLGLSEVSGLPVLVVRVIFVALLFANGAGFWLYVLFSLLMPVHPDDRQYLWRFQIARALRRMTSRS